jgi:DNA-binding transcriptional ArsR family regulator
MAVERSTRAPVLDLARPAALEVEFDVAEAAEVLMSICALADPDEHETFDLGADWLRARLEALPPDLAASVAELGLGSTKMAAHLLGVVLETPQPRTFDAFLARLEAIDPVELKLHLLGYYGTPSAHFPAPEVLARAARGDAEARAEILAAIAEYSDKHDLFRRLLELDGEELKSRLLEILPRWHEIAFASTAAEWRDAAERDAAAKRALAKRHPPEQLTELATRGYRYTAPPGIRRLTFFPSWWMRPWVMLHEHRGTKIFCYPIAGGERDADGSSPAELARIYKALGDEGRLRLLRRLNEGTLKLSDAAAELGVAKSTAHHHLAILRQAGFVTVREEDEKEYSLRPDLVPQAGELLAGYLGTRSSSTSA